MFQQRVSVAGACCVGWRFHLHERDLNFGIFFEPTAGGASAARTLRPMARVDARAAEEGTSGAISTREYTGDIEVRGDGVCVLTWDNTYSYFTSKELTFQYSASSPAIKSQKRLDELRTVLVEERGELQAAVERAVAMQEEMARLREDVEARQGHVTQIAGALASTALALVPENARAHIFGYGTVHDLAASWTLVSRRWRRWGRRPPSATRATTNTASTRTCTSSTWSSSASSSSGRSTTPYGLAPVAI